MASTVRKHDRTAAASSDWRPRAEGDRQPPRAGGSSRIIPIANTNAVILWSIDRTGVLTSADADELRMLGASPDCAIGVPVSDAFATIPELIALAHQALAGTSTMVVMPANGVVYEVRVEPLRGTSGGVTGAMFAATSTDRALPTGRGLADLALRYRSLVESVPAIFYIVDPEPPYTPQYVSKGSDLLGYTIEEWICAPSLWLKILHPLDREWVLTETEAAIAAGEETDYEYRVVARDGSVRWLHDRSRFVRNADGKPVSWQGVMLDITARKEAEAALRDSESRYRLLFEESPLPMWVYDQQTGAFLAVNEAAVTHYGYSRSEFLAKTTQDVVVSEPSQAAYASDDQPRSPASPESLVHTVKHRKRDGSVITVQVTSRDTALAGRPACLVLAQDVSAQEILQAQLRQAQKLESIGRLAGGIAHDFNNLLTVISCYGQSLLAALPAGTTGHEDVSEILAASTRAASLTRQLLAFGRKQMLSPRPVNLSDVVRGIEPMLRRLIGEHIKIVTQLGSVTGEVRVDVAQIEQVLINLAVNARDAMPNGGVLTIAVADIGLEHVPDWPDAPVPGRYVRLSVSDTGSGMDSATLDRVFEPFFTTKDVGKGTGLGLATVYGIVKQSGGFVRALSRPGCGATFETLIPRSGDQTQRGVATALPGALPRGSDTILLVEDEDAVRQVTARSLRGLGYTVLEARNGHEAIDIAREKPAVDLVVTDVVMPELGGAALAERLTAYLKPLRILFVSGYTNDATMLAGNLPQGASFLQKPFAQEQLAQAVRAALGNASSR